MDNSPINASWLANLQNGDEAAVRRLWNDYFTRIVRLAARKMQNLRLRAADEEDIALSAMNSFYQMARKREEPIADPTELWKLLATITNRKVNKERQRQYAGKRREQLLAGESIFGDEALPLGINQIASETPAPEAALELAETLEAILSCSNADQIIELRLEGYSNSEIAAKIGCSTRTVQRSIEKIHNQWTVCLDQIREKWECSSHNG